MRPPFRRLLVANRSEIAIRVFRAATELGIATVAVYAEEDKLSLHRFKADEAYQIGKGKGPVEAYLSIDEVIRVARDAKADAIHPGYGLLSESPEFAEACAAAGIVFIGPRAARRMRTLGNKVDARNLAISVGVPVMPATEPLPDDPEAIKAAGRAPSAIRSCSRRRWGGGGRGMRPIESEDELLDAVFTAKREAKAAFGKDEVYLEKLVRRARHVEVQILGDTHGTSSTCSSATARSSGATRRSSSARPRPISTRSSAPNCARRRSRSAARRTMSAPARSSS